MPKGFIRGWVSIMAGVFIAMSDDSGAKAIGFSLVVMGGVVALVAGLVWLFHPHHQERETAKEFSQNGRN